MLDTTKIKNVFMEILQFLFKSIYSLLKFVGLNNSDIVIIAGYKARYLSSNNKFLFEYLNSISDKEFDLYFYTKDKKTYKKLISKYPGKILYPYNISTPINLLKAKVLIITTGYSDFLPYPLLKDKKIINLWHGTFKMIGYGFLTTKLKRFKNFTKSIDYFTASSDYEASGLKKAFKLKDENIAVTGLQKNDYINFPNDEVLKKFPYLSKKVILYAPTFRDKGMITKSFNNLFPINELNTLLEKYDAHFVYRAHFNTTEWNILQKFPRIHSISSDVLIDAQPLLYHTDILITDYSSIFIDFLLMDSPIIFYDYDYEEYKKHRGFLFDYFENTPGKKIEAAEKIIDAIEEYIKNPQFDVEKREMIKKRFHKYSDGKNCERTYKLIKELL